MTTPSNRDHEAGYASGAAHALVAAAALSHEQAPFPSPGSLRDFIRAGARMTIVGLFVAPLRREAIRRAFASPRYTELEADVIERALRRTTRPENRVRRPRGADL